MSCKYSIIPVTLEDKDEVLQFLRKFYFKEEPLLSSNLDSTEEFLLEVERYTIIPLNQGISLKAVSSDGDLLGVMINNIVTRDQHFSSHTELEGFHNPTFLKVAGLYTKAYSEFNVFDTFPRVDKVMEVWLTATSKACRRHGVGKSLLVRTEHLAEKLQCQVIWTDCSSAYSSKCTELMGYQLMYSLPYFKYVDSEGRPVFTPEPPHVTFNTYIYWLDPACRL